MIRYSGEQWTVTRTPAGFVLTLASSPRHALHIGRRLLVVTDGVHECSRDGEATPLVLIDCNSEIYARCVKALA